MRTLSFRPVVVGAALICLAGARPALAQGTIDFTKVEIKTNKVTSNFYALDGAGGTIGVLTGPDGVFMVDAQYAPLTDKIVAAIRQISDGRIRFMVNTHVHPDHTGGNENLGKMGVTILSRDQLRARLAGGQRPAPAAALPTITYNETTTIHMNGEDVRLIPIRVAHTDGDTLVHFPGANVLMTGDFYRSAGYPFFDRANGGTYAGLMDALQTVVDLAKPDTKIVPGHGEIVSRNEVAAHRGMAIAIHDRVANLVRQGKTADEVVAAKVTADYDAKVPQAATTSERYLRALHAELSGAK